MTEDKQKPALQKIRSESYRAMVWRRLWRNRRGMIGFYFVAFMGMVAFFSPLLATNQPVVCRYQGKWYFPAIVELFQARNTEASN